MKKTAQFVSCKGVFQGGGCRGVALAGAYAEAHAAGVRFSEVAGTSAGSIVAALVGAGASPDFLLDVTKSLDYMSFLVPPTNIDWKRNVKTRFAELFARILHRDLKKFFRHGGMYSSRKIEEWIDEQLGKLIPTVQGKVTFADLPTPTHIVAANVFSREPKVWSSVETPNASVAYAVRASCSIPVFFQPVVEGSTIYVDGGILSNLPLFVFSQGEAESRQVYERTLAFTLSSDRQGCDVLDSIQHLLELVDLSIEGATRIQKNLQPAVNAIDTNTGDLTATDFHKMNDSSTEELVVKGRTSALSFFREERIHTAGRSYLQTEVWDEHQAYYSVVERATSVQSHAIILDAGTKWFWELFPTVLGWLRRGVTVSCQTLRLSGDQTRVLEEKQRRACLQGLGVSVVENDALPFEGILLDPKDPSEPYALVRSDQQSDFSPWGRIYSGRQDALAIRAIRNSLTVEGDAASKPSIQQVDPDEVIDLLRKGVVHYRNPGVKLEMQEVPIKEVKLLSRYVRGFRLRQLDQLLLAFEESGLQLHEPAKLLLEDGSHSIVTPPVFEKSGSSYIAIEGNTRSFLAFEGGRETILGFVVENVSESLPGRPIGLSNVRIATSKLAPENRIDGFNHKLFRPIERATHPLPEDCR